MTNRNIGKFRLDANFIHNQPKRVAEVFAIMKCVPVRAEMLFYSDEIEYWAISERFAEIPKGQMVPEYLLQITQNESGQVELVEIKPYE